MTTFLKSVAIILLVIIFLYAISLFELYTQLSRYQNYWTKNNQKPIAQNDVLYVALGDSTAQGIGATKANRGYVGVVANAIAQKNGKNVHTTNLSKSGGKLKDVLDTQLPELKKLPVNDQTIITVEIGANDMIDFEAQKFESEMDRIMSQLPKQTLITDMPYFSQSRFKAKENNVVTANQIMYTLAAKHNFKLLPLHQRMKDNGGLKTLAPDLFHPTDVAYKQNWAHVFLERL